MTRRVAWVTSPAVLAAAGPMACVAWEIRRAVREGRCGHLDRNRALCKLRDRVHPAYREAACLTVQQAVGERTCRVLDADAWDPRMGCSKYEAEAAVYVLGAAEDAARSVIASQRDPTRWVHDAFVIQLIEARTVERAATLAGEMVK